MSLNRDDIIEAYRAFLGREPESETVIAYQIAGCPDLWSLLRAMLDSEEFGIRMAGLHAPSFSVLKPRCAVQMTGNRDDLARLRAHVQETWTQLGETQPHHSVLTGPEFLPEQMTSQNTELFYATGAAWVEELLAVLERNGLSIPRGLVVDFGCGLGRVGEHLSTQVDRYLGVDISSSHLAMAKARLQSIGRTNAEFELLPAFMQGQRKASLIYSSLVLQHNPPPVMLEMLNYLLSRLEDGGLAFIQIPTVIYNYTFDPRTYLDHIDDAKNMEMHPLPQKHVFKSIRENDCRLVEVYQDGCAGSLGESFRFLIEKPAGQNATPGSGNFSTASDFCPGNA